MALLQDLSQTDMLARIAELEAANARLKARGQRKLTMKVTVSRQKEDGTWTQGGGLSVYGMGKFPVTLYRGQWERLLECKDEILTFIEDNSDTLSTKD